MLTGFRTDMGRLRFLVILFVIILEGCKPDDSSSNQKVNNHQTAPTFESTSLSIEPSQTPIFSLEHSTPASTLISSAEKRPLVSLSTQNSVPIPSAVGYGVRSEADYVALGRQATGQVILQKVPLVNQLDYTSCGEAAFAMGWNYRHPNWVLDIGTLELTGLKIGVYFPALGPKPQGYLGTSPAGMEAIGNYYAEKYELIPPTVGNINLDGGGGYAQLEARGLLYSQLSANNPVIIEVTDAIGSPSKTYNDSHYVTVTGMNFDTGMVTYNDPLVNISMSGKYSGYNRLAEWSAIWASWANNKDINPGLGGHPGRGWYMIVH
jgi:hypothetical protein